MKDSSSSKKNAKNDKPRSTRSLDLGIDDGGDSSSKKKTKKHSKSKKKPSSTRKLMSEGTPTA